MLIATDGRNSRSLPTIRPTRGEWRRALHRVRRGGNSYIDHLRRRMRQRRAAALGMVALLAVLAGGWLSTDRVEPTPDPAQLFAALPGESVTPPAIRAPADQDEGDQAEAVTEPEVHTASSEASAVSRPATVTWAPDRRWFEQHPSDHLPLDKRVPVRMRVVTIQARVTAYTPYDHSQTKPQWADGVVAWHPGGKRRHVANHRYCLATDWKQFPPGATFISVPGYMEQSFPDVPERFRVVDDACGQARKARRHGRKPVIDVRFMTRHSAISGRNAWGSRDLEVEVIFPAGFQIPQSLRRWVVADEMRTYYQGERID